IALAHVTIDHFDVGFAEAHIGPDVGRALTGNLRDFALVFQVLGLIFVDGQAVQFSVETGDSRSQLDARLRPAGTRAEHYMIDALPAHTQLLHQLDHRDYIAGCSDAVRAADADHVRLATLGAELLGKLTQFRRALRPLNPVFPCAE